MSTAISWTNLAHWELRRASNLSLSSSNLESSFFSLNSFLILASSGSVAATPLILFPCCLGIQALYRPSLRNIWLTISCSRKATNWFLNTLKATLVTSVEGSFSGGLRNNPRDSVVAIMTQLCQELPPRNLVKVRFTKPTAAKPRQ